MEHIIQASDVAHTMQHWHISISSGTQNFTESCIEPTLNIEGHSDKDPYFGTKISLSF
jgi:hypothetical protein